MPNNPWDTSGPVKCIVLCAGRGTRMGQHSDEKPKVMFEIGGRPILHYVIEYWRRFTEDFIFIVGYKKEMIIDYITSEAINASFVEQKERKGIAHAILQAEGHINDRFIVVLGDCLCKGEFAFPDEMDQGVGVWRTSNERDIKQSYSIEEDRGMLRRVVEKPTVLPNDLCGMGYYFFRKKVFDYIRNATPSALRGEVEITDVIQQMIDAGEPVSPLMFNGEYINITFIEDIQRATGLVQG